MNFRNISSWCIRNPVFPIVLFVGLMLAGLISFARMQVNNAPDIDFPAATVSIIQPGAAPNEIETQITQRVESAIRGVNGVDEINSSVSEGNSFTFVHLPARHAHGPRRQRRSQRNRPDPRQPSRRHSRAAGHARRRRRRADLLCRRADHRHDARAIELVHRQQRGQAPPRRVRGRGGPARRRRRPHHPRHPRSRGASGAGHHGRPGQ